MIINVFLLSNEVFKEFYTGNLHVASARYLFFGLHGHNSLVPWIWTAMALNLTACSLLVLPLSRSLRWLNVACVWHRRYLDRERHGPRRPGIRSQSARSDCRIHPR